MLNMKNAGKFLKTAHVMAAAIGALLLTPALGHAQSAPASWATKAGRWDHWKDKTFATSKAHYEALKAAAHGGVKQTRTSIPSWAGVWTNINFGPGAPSSWGPTNYKYSGGVVSVLPPAKGPGPELQVLTPAYQQKLHDELDRVSHGVEWDYLSYCLPAGFPRWYTEPFLREFITTPAETWMINEQQSEVRRIYTDGRGHVPDDESYSVWEGDSVGFWDGDTLVIHTISLKPGNWNRSRPEYSDKVETVELVRLNKQGIVETRMTVYDPESLQKPWHVIFGSKKVTSPPDLRINLWTCNENNNVVKTNTGGSTFVLPGEAGYKEPGAFAVPPPAGK